MPVVQSKLINKKKDASKNVKPNLNAKKKASTAGAGAGTAGTSKTSSDAKQKTVNAANKPKGKLEISLLVEQFYDAKKAKNLTAAQKKTKQALEDFLVEQVKKFDKDLKLPAKKSTQKKKKNDSSDDTDETDNDSDDSGSDSTCSCSSCCQSDGTCSCSSCENDDSSSADDDWETDDVSSTETESSSETDSSTDSEAAKKPMKRVRKTNVKSSDSKVKIESKQTKVFQLPAAGKSADVKKSVNRKSLPASSAAKSCPRVSLGANNNRKC